MCSLVACADAVETFNGSIAQSGMIQIAVGLIQIAEIRIERQPPFKTIARGLMLLGVRVKPGYEGTPCERSHGRNLAVAKGFKLVHPGGQPMRNA